MSDKKLLTPLELKIMNVLWKLKEAFVKEIIEELPADVEKNPKPPHKPAYNTVSTTIRILEEKNYVDHKAFGRTHQYFPTVSRFAYQKRLMHNVLDNAFSGSVSGLVSALLDDKKISDKDIKEIEDMLRKEEE